MGSRALKIGVLLVRAAWPASEKLAVPHAGFIKFHAARLPRGSSLEGAMMASFEKRA
jgi:hypothetical protein